MVRLFFVLGAAAVVVIAALTLSQGTLPWTQRGATAPGVAAGLVPPDGAVGAGQAVSDAEAVPLVAEPSAEQIAAIPDNATQEVTTPPRIDLLRVEPSGQALLAGRGTFGWEIDILLDRDQLAVVRPEIDGAFTVFLDIPPADAPRSLTLVMRRAEAEIASEEVLVIAPARVLAGANTDDAADADDATDPELAEAPANAVQVPRETAALGSEDTEDTPETRDAASASLSAPDTEAPDTVAPDTEAPDTVADAPVRDAAVAPSAQEGTASVADASGRTAPRASPGLPEPPQAPVVFRADARGAQVLQAPEASVDLALDTISYDAAGEVSLAGRGAAEFVRIYLDNSPLITSPIASDGSWRVALPEVEQGIYTLRIDALDAEGRVSSRVETPFLREDRTLLAAEDSGGREGADPAAQVRIVTVQPGNTLWALARDRYGDGFLYVRIFQANRENIRNPDLIYPGQIFELPE